MQMPPSLPQPNSAFGNIIGALAICLRSLRSGRRNWPPLCSTFGKFRSPTASRSGPTACSGWSDHKPMARQVCGLLATRRRNSPSLALTKERGRLRRRTIVDRIAFRPGYAGCLPELTLPVDADIGRDVSGDFISQARAELHIGQGCGSSGGVFIGVLAECGGGIAQPQPRL